MEKIESDQEITIITEDISSSNSVATATNEIMNNNVTGFEGNDESGDLTAMRSIKRTELIQSTEKGSTSAKNPVYVEWHGLNYFIPIEDEKTFWQKSGKSDLESGKTKFRPIIENIHGCANPGEVLAIMGPSGCGKTTLLNLLGNRVGNKGVQGTITMNGYKPTKGSKRHVAYCTQDDIFFPRLTVRDTLTFTARLRLPREMSRRDKLKQVENTMQLLNLMKCADTKIGDNRVRGVSGGERKRVNIAAELLTDPSVILLDEPTSGLDSSLALELTKILKEFAVKQRKTIIMVIHQPSSQVFESFDKLMLMADGHVVYFGERAGMVDYLANQGFKCHPNFNPADYILELLNDNANKQKLINAYAYQVREDPTGKQVVENYSHRIRNNNKPNDDDIIYAPVKSDRRWEATFLQQVSILTERTFKQSKSVILSKIDIIQALALALVCSIVWLQMPFAEANINDRVGSIFFTCVFWVFHPLIGSVSAFPLDIVMLSKERQSRSYRLSSYFLSKQIAEVPLILLNPAIFTIVVYWASSLLPDFGRFVAYLIVILLGTLIAQSFGYFFGATLLNVQKSISASMVFMLSSMLLGGFYVRNLPSSLAWLKYLSFIKYLYSLCMQIQFDSPKAQFKCGTAATLGIGQTSICDSVENGPMDSIPGIVILENEHLNDLPWYINLIVILAIIFIMRFLAYYSLRRNSRINNKE